MLFVRLHKDVSGPRVGANCTLLVNRNRTQRLRSKLHQWDNQARCYCSEAAKLYSSDPFYRQNKECVGSCTGLPVILLEKNSSQLSKQIFSEGVNRMHVFK